MASRRHKTKRAGSSGHHDPLHARVALSPTSRLRAWWRTPVLPLEGLIVGSTLYLASVTNGVFWYAIARTGHLKGLVGAAILVALVIIVAVAYALPLCLLLPRAAAKPVLWTLIFLSAVVSHWSSPYLGCLDHVAITEMLQSQYLPLGWISWETSAAVTAQMLLPTWVLWRVQILRAPRFNLTRRVFNAVALAAIAGIAVTGAPRTDFVHLSHFHRSLRYFVAPGNGIVAMLRWVGAEPGGLYGWTCRTGMIFAEPEFATDAPTPESSALPPPR